VLDDPKIYQEESAIGIGASASGCPRELESAVDGWTRKVPKDGRETRGRDVTAGITSNSSRRYVMMRFVVR
jgi:hypothetical protein